MRNEVALAILGAFAAIPVVASAVRKPPAEPIHYCEDYPLDNQCVCPEDYIKQQRWVGWDEEKQQNIHEYYCVPKQYDWIPIDPNDPNIEQKLIDAARYILLNIWPDIVPELSCQPCNGINQQPTPDKPKWFQVGAGYNQIDDRYIGMVECVEITEWDEQGRMKSGRTCFTFRFYLDDGGLLSFGNDLFYANPDRTHYWRCDGPTDCYDGAL